MFSFSIFEIFTLQYQEFGTKYQVSEAKNQVFEPLGCTNPIIIPISVMAPFKVNIEIGNGL